MSHFFYRISSFLQWSRRPVFGSYRSGLQWSKIRKIEKNHFWGNQKWTIFLDQKNRKMSTFPKFGKSVAFLIMRLRRRFLCFLAQLGAVFPGVKPQLTGKVSQKGKSGATCFSLIFHEFWRYLVQKYVSTPSITISWFYRFLMQLFPVFPGLTFFSPESSGLKKTTQNATFFEKIPPPP